MQHRTVNSDAGCLIAPSCNTTPIKTDVRRYAWLNLGIDLRFPRGPFNDLVAYIEENKEKERGLPEPNLFGDVLSYTSSITDKETNEEKCIAIRTHGVIDISTASAEMNSVAVKNRRCTDPAYHFILSWPEHEKPGVDKIFDAAEDALAAIGLAEHQYVLAVHGNTDNRHCHVAVSRIHPITFKSRNIEWAHKTLHYAARQSEIKHGWTNDNGIYIVQTDAGGNKTIVLNPDHAQGRADGAPKTGRGPEDKILPTWHDPETLESWLKTTVARELKRAMPKLRNWADLRAWLQTKGIVCKREFLHTELSTVGTMAIGHRTEAIVSDWRWQQALARRDVGQRPAR